MTVSAKEKAAKSSAWFLYTLIVLEILFMVSPFAAYYYSIYATPLNALQQTGATAWLTMYVLPHFAYSDSWLANALILISWPLILTGLVAFLVGFCQIYWSKITRKGAVEGGLYRRIRHPQYSALAIVGLGCSLYWSRFIVIVAFVSMLCLYYFLARTEERICLEKFGDPYRDYLQRTGRFLPRSWEAPWKALDWRLPETRLRRALAVAAVYLAAVLLTVAGSGWLRSHVVDSLHTDVSESLVTVYLAPVDAGTRAAVARLLGDADLSGDIAYVAPASWSVPELGLRRTEDAGNGAGFAELIHPTTHGNSLAAARDRLNVVVTEVSYLGDDEPGMPRLSRALNLRPMSFLEIDVAGQRIVGRRNAADGQWAGIPVPTF